MEASLKWSQLLLLNWNFYARASPINSFNLFSSLFENERRKVKIDLNWRALAHWWERLRGELGWFVGGLRAAAAARQQANKEDQLAPQLVFFLLIDGWNWLKWSEINGIQSINKEMRLKKLMGMELNKANVFAFVKWNVFGPTASEIKQLFFFSSISLRKASKASEAKRVKRRSQQRERKREWRAAEQLGWALSCLVYWLRAEQPPINFLQSLRDCWLVSLPAQLRNTPHANSLFFRGPTQKEKRELAWLREIENKRNIIEGVWGMMWRGMIWWV